MRASSPLLASPASEMGLTAAIAVILLAANFTIANAQQQLTIQPEEIQDGTTAARIFQSIEDSFRLQVPKGWMIHIVNNTGSTFETEVQQGYRILAQLCPEEQQQGVLSIANTSTNSSISNANNNCQRTQQELIHIVRYPDLDTKLQLANNVTNHNMTTDNILSYHLQKLQEVGYKGIHIVNSTETTINLTNPDTNQTIARVPAKLVETTYSTVSAPNETRRGYFLLTATNATAPNPGTTKGYTIFYEGSSLAAATTTAYGSLLPPTPVRQVFDSFQLIAAPEVAQAIAQQAQAAETAEGRGGDNNDNGAHEHRGNDRDNNNNNNDNGAHEHRGNDGDNNNNNNDNGAHEHRGNDRDNRGHHENGHGHNNGNGNREGGQDMAERIIEKTERMVDRIMSRR